MPDFCSTSSASSRWLLSSFRIHRPQQEFVAGSHARVGPSHVKCVLSRQHRDNGGAQQPRLRYVRHSNGETYIRRQLTHPIRWGRPSSDSQVGSREPAPATTTGEEEGQDHQPADGGRPTEVSPRELLSKHTEKISPKRRAWASTNGGKAQWENWKAAKQAEMQQSRKRWLDDENSKRSGGRGWTGLWRGRSRSKTHSSWLGTRHLGWMARSCYSAGKAAVLFRMAIRRAAELHT